jgi:hypothetical protein
MTSTLGGLWFAAYVIGAIRTLVCRTLATKVNLREDREEAIIGLPEDRKIRNQRFGDELGLWMK